MERWTASEANQLRELLGLRPEAFARRLTIHKRTVLRWRDGDTDPAAAIQEDLDNLLSEAARKLAHWLALDQLDQLDQLAKMHRRDLLRLLAASSNIPVGGIDLWNGLLTQVSTTSLESLEEITTVLASLYRTSPPHLLLSPVTGHLEKASALLGAAMKPSQRRRLESVVADVSVFVGVLSMHTGKLAQARAHLWTAEKMAQQAGNMALLPLVYAEQALLDYYSQAPTKDNDDPRLRIERLEDADQLARRYAPAIVQMIISTQLAEDKAAAKVITLGSVAAAKDAYDADKALERSGLALAKAQGEGPVGTGFCSSAGVYSGWDQGRLEGFRGAVELSLGRTSAIDTITTSLELKTVPSVRAYGLIDLAIALIGQKRPEEACDRLVEAHAIGLDRGSAVILHTVFSARTLMPPKWNTLRCVRQLDDRLGLRGQLNRVWWS
ncbi:MAG: hypothetical protein ACRDYX_00630 [Egibacteraceae bacterium]